MLFSNQSEFLNNFNRLSKFSKKKFPKLELEIILIAKNKKVHP